MCKTQTCPQDIGVNVKLHSKKMKRGGGNSQSMQSNAVFSTLRSGHHLDIEDPDPNGCVQKCPGPRTPRCFITMVLSFYKTLWRCKLW